MLTKILVIVAGTSFALLLTSLMYYPFIHDAFEDSLAGGDEQEILDHWYIADGIGLVAIGSFFTFLGSIICIGVRVTSEELRDWR